MIVLVHVKSIPTHDQVTATKTNSYCYHGSQFKYKIYMIFKNRLTSTRNVI